MPLHLTPEAEKQIKQHATLQMCSDVLLTQTEMRTATRTVRQLVHHLEGLLQRWSVPAMALLSGMCRWHLCTCPFLLQIQMVAGLIRAHDGAIKCF